MNIHAHTEKHTQRKPINHLIFPIKRLKKKDWCFQGKNNWTDMTACSNEQITDLCAICSAKNHILRGPRQQGAISPTGNIPWKPPSIREIGEHLHGSRVRVYTGATVYLCQIQSSPVTWSGNIGSPSLAGLTGWHRVSSLTPFHLNTRGQPSTFVLWFSQLRTEVTGWKMLEDDRGQGWWGWMLRRGKVTFQLEILEVGG